MKSRCTNPKTSGYHRYGGRGIKVCEEWQHDFQAFFDYMGPRPSPDHQLDRINNDGNYEPGNVKWSTRLEQMNNKSNTVIVRNSPFIESGSERLTFVEAMHRTGLSEGGMRNRLRRNWPKERLLEPIRVYRRRSRIES